jgi:hypothetical protein
MLEFPQQLRQFIDKIFHVYVAILQILIKRFDLIEYFQMMAGVLEVLVAHKLQ